MQPAGYHGIGMARLARRDRAAAGLDRETLKRAWGFGRQYRVKLILYIVTIAASRRRGRGAAAGVQAPDRHRHPAQGPRQVNLLFVLAVGLRARRVGDAVDLAAGSAPTSARA